MYIILFCPCRLRTQQQIEIYNSDCQSEGNQGKRALLGDRSPPALLLRSGVGKETALHTDLRAVV